jgi:hypothetical protein
LFRLWATLSLVVLIGLLVGLSACTAPQSTRAQQSTTNPPNPNREAIAQALSTRIAEQAGLVVTSQALQTQPADFPTPTPSMIPTLDTPLPTAEESQSSSFRTNIPPDIVLPPGEQVDLFVSQNLITFQILANFQQLVGFYENQMALSGWKKEALDSYTTDAAALLIFTKGDTKVSISLRLNSLSGLTTIVITSLS